MSTEAEDRPTATEKALCCFCERSVAIGSDGDGIRMDLSRPPGRWMTMWAHLGCLQGCVTPEFHRYLDDAFVSG